MGYNNELLALAKNLERNRFKVILAKNSEDARREGIGPYSSTFYRWCCQFRHR